MGHRDTKTHKSQGSRGCVDGDPRFSEYGAGDPSVLIMAKL